MMILKRSGGGSRAGGDATRWRMTRVLIIFRHDTTRPGPHNNTKTNHALVTPWGKKCHIHFCDMSVANLI